MHEGNKIIKIGEGTLKNKYPIIYKHLLSNKTELEKRSIEKTISWFEYGRSQGFSIVPEEKLLISSMITKQIRISKIESHCVAYSGTWIIKKAVHDLEVY